MNSTYTEIKLASIGTLMTLDLATSSIVIAVMVKYPQLREDRTNLFMLSLMVSDISYGITVMPLCGLMCTGAGNAIRDIIPKLPSIQLVFGRMLAATSFNSLAWVTLCKTIAITKPFVYERYLSTTRCYILIALIWVFSFIIGIVSLRVDVTWNPYVCKTRIHRSSAGDAITEFSFLLGISIPVILIIYGTAKIFMVIVRTHHEITSQVQSIGGGQGAGGQTTSATLQSIRSGKKVLIICASVIVITVPTIAYDIQRSASRNSDDLHLASFFIMWIAPCNSFVNSMLFVFLYRNVRNKTAEMMKNMGRCTT